MLGFGVNAAVRCGVDDRQGLEQLSRYIPHPAPAKERVQTNAAGQLVAKLKSPLRDENKHPILNPLQISNGRSAATKSTGSTSAVGRYRQYDN